MSRKYRALRALEEDLQLWGVMDATIYLEDHEYGLFEQEVRASLRALEDEGVSLNALYAVRRLLGAALSQATGRNPKGAT